jgi:hypothetical protein
MTQQTEGCFGKAMRTRFDFPEPQPKNTTEEKKEEDAQLEVPSY